jgi:four helix bundle protein
MARSRRSARATRAAEPEAASAGFARRTRPDKARLFNTAQASLEELRYFFILSDDLGYLSAPTFEAEAEEISRMLASYVAKLSSGS